MLADSELGDGQLPDQCCLIVSVFLCVLVYVYISKGNV